ncbi:hypothetical protein B0H11DRAFT_1909909 [Mycena galericulata]|nr:hypothetical protein B0H11DRAFT_1909909 [Mycena galericulata]
MIPKERKKLALELRSYSFYNVLQLVLLDPYHKSDPRKEEGTVIKSKTLCKAGKFHGLSPFLTRHGAILDFGKRELRFPNGNVVPVLPLDTEANLVRERNATKKESTYSKAKVPNAALPDHTI